MNVKFILSKLYIVTENGMVCIFTRFFLVFLTYTGFKMVTYLNKHFRFVFTPKEDVYGFNPAMYGEETLKYRFLIGAGQIQHYIGIANANKVILAALNSKTDKVTVKFRKYGKIEIYVK